MRLVHRRAGLRVYLTRGELSNPLLTVRGRSVILLPYAPGPEGVRTRATMHFKVDGTLAQALASVFPGAVKGIVLEKSAVFIGAARTISERIAENPRGVYDELVANLEIPFGAVGEYLENILPPPPAELPVFPAELAPLLKHPPTLEGEGPAKAMDGRERDKTPTGPPPGTKGDEGASK